MRVPTLFPDCEAVAVREASCALEGAVSAPATQEVGPVPDPIVASGVTTVVLAAIANRLSTAADRAATTAGAVIVDLLPVADAEARTGVASRTPDQACSTADHPVDEASGNDAAFHVPSARTVCWNVDTRSDEPRLVVRTEVQPAGVAMAPLPWIATVASSTSPARRPAGALLTAAVGPVPVADVPLRKRAPLRAGATAADDADEV